MGQAFVQVDAFTATPFAGNPAVVFLLPAPRDAQWMQAIAREMNVPETAFLVREGDVFALRWFTPTIEVDLCGHATLASAHALWEQGTLPLQEAARFDTRSGRLTATRGGDWISLDFPSEPAQAAESPPALLRGLGVQPLFVGINRFDYLVEVDSEETVRALQPDFTQLRMLTARGVIVTSRASSGGYDFVSRFFAPAAGIDEDPVTGSAHCCLAPFWCARLGRDELVGYQASARGGVVRVHMGAGRVALGGQAVTVVRGEVVA